MLVQYTGILCGYAVSYQNCKPCYLQKVTWQYMCYEIQVASWSDLWVYGRLLAGIVGFNLTRGRGFWDT